MEKQVVAANTFFFIYGGDNLENPFFTFMVGMNTYNVLLVKFVKCL